MLREIGAGLMIWPNGARSLQELGVEINALTVEHISLATSRGRQLIDFPVSAIRERFGFPVAFVHRADLQSGLAAKFGADGLRLGSEIVGFDDGPNQVVVSQRDGTRAAGDLLVGADGLRSPVRRQLLADGEPAYLGSTIWRGIASSEGIDLPTGAGIDWVGRGSEFIAFHLPNQKIYWAGVTREPAGEKWGPGGQRADLVERFGDWVRPIPDLIEATDDADIIRNDMYDRPPVRHWSRGRVTLVGDAAHPMTPNMGQGACQALDDAVALGASLELRPNLAEGFSEYERRRLRRANRVVSLSRQSTRGVQMDNPVLCYMRDSLGSMIASRLIIPTLAGIFEG